MAQDLLVDYDTHKWFVQSERRHRKWGKEGQGSWITILDLINIKYENISWNTNLPELQLISIQQRSVPKEKRVDSTL